MYFSSLHQELLSFHRTVTDIMAGQKFRQLPLNMEFGEFTLTGHLDHVGPSGLVQYRHAVVKPNDILRSWISHLALNCLSDDLRHGTGKTTIYAAKDHTYSYAPALESRDLLMQLLDLYWLGLRAPLCFFSRTSLAYAEHIHKDRTEQEALHKANMAWEGNDFSGKGERDDPYNLLCFRNQDLGEPPFTELALRIFLPAINHREKYNP